MKKFIPLFLLLAATVSAAEVARISPADAAHMVAAGAAVLVDVREPAEWVETGVAAPAVLLPKSDFDGAQMQLKDFLTTVSVKQVILYCRTVNRSGKVAGILAAKGYKVANAGGFKDWEAAGLPTRKVGPEKP